MEKMNIPDIIARFKYISKLKWDAVIERKNLKNKISKFCREQKRIKVEIEQSEKSCISLTNLAAGYAGELKGMLETLSTEDKLKVINSIKENERIFHEKMDKLNDG